MRALVVCCHPLPTSLSHRFADAASDGFITASHQVERLDLYAESYRPALSAEERLAYYGDPAPLRSPEADQLRRAEILVLAFPAWWFSLPAMLKGWIDRSFAPDVAFAHATDFGPIKPLLADLRHVVAAATFGSPWWVDRLAMGRPVRKMLKGAVFRACAPQARFHYLPFYAAEKPDSARVEAAVERLRATVGRLR